MTVSIFPCGTEEPRYLCQSATGRFWILLETQAAPGDLVLCRCAGHYVIRRFAGQPCLGTLSLVRTPSGEGVPAAPSRDEAERASGRERVP